MRRREAEDRGGAHAEEFDEISVGVEQLRVRSVQLLVVIVHASLPAADPRAPGGSESKTKATADGDLKAHALQDETRNTVGAHAKCE